MSKQRRSRKTTMPARAVSQFASQVEERAQTVRCYCCAPYGGSIRAAHNWWCGWDGWCKGAKAAVEAMGFSMTDIPDVQLPRVADKMDQG